MTDADQSGSLKFSAGYYERNIVSRADRTYRSVKVEHCRLTGGDPKVLKVDFQNAAVEFFIHESFPGDVHWENDPTKIGAISIDRHTIRVFVPTHGFEAIWQAALAIDGVFRRLAVSYEVRGDTHVAVTDFYFEETPPQNRPPEYEKSGRPVFVNPR